MSFISQKSGKMKDDNESGLQVISKQTTSTKSK